MVSYLEDRSCYESLCDECLRVIRLIDARLIGKIDATTGQVRSLATASAAVTATGTICCAACCNGKSSNAANRQQALISARSSGRRLVVFAVNQADTVASTMLQIVVRSVGPGRSTIKMPSNRRLGQTPVVTD